MTIFLAEDNPADVYLLKEALAAESTDNINVVVAQDGEEALDFVERRGVYHSAAKPDLIILDLNLPKSAFIVLIHRTGKYLTAGGDTVIESGDHLLLMADSKEAVSQIHDCFGTRES